MESYLQQLLRIVVDAYITSGEPVGSQTLVERYRLDMSPATVRNWFAELEELGYLERPHSSGGRLPTEKGFRAYIDWFVSAKPASKRERERIERTAGRHDEQGIKRIAKTLADVTGLTVVVDLGEAGTFYTGLSQLFTQPEFHNWQRVVSLMEVLDRLDETFAALHAHAFDEPEIFIGRGCPFGSSCGSVLGSVGGSLIGILGPIRMDYQHAFSLMGSVYDLYYE